MLTAYQFVRDTAHAATQRVTPLSRSEGFADVSQFSKKSSAHGLGGEFLHVCLYFDV
jgi:hypothetical protein